MPPQAFSFVAVARAAHPPLSLPPAVKGAVWRADELGRSCGATLSTGWPEFDSQLPGRGWPLGSITEIITAQPAVLEWRLLAPALRTMVGQVVVVGPSRQPHLPGLQHVGLDERQLVWIQAETPAERLWVTEQLVRSGSAGAVVAWLPQARQEQLRRLQVAVHAGNGFVALCRPDAARHEASAAPLRVQAHVRPDWELEIRILKRQGPMHDGVLILRSVPGGLASVLTPRLRRPSRLIPHSDEAADAVGRTAAVGGQRPLAAVL